MKTIALGDLSFAVQDEGEPLFIVVNSGGDSIEVKTPAWTNVSRWSRVLDTAANSVLDGEKAEAPGAKLIASPTSILAFAGKP